MSEELKPCPFCGLQDAYVEQLDSDSSVVICCGRIDEHTACLARGPVGLQEDDFEAQPGRAAAVREWNRRASPAATEPVAFMYTRPEVDRPLFYHLRQIAAGWKETPLYAAPVRAVRLPEVEGDQLPALGSTVLIHLGSTDTWVPHTVAGYYAWGNLGGNDSLHRVFVRVRDADGYLNARLLKDVRKIDAQPATPQQ